MKYNPLVFGKNQTENVVAVEVKDGDIIMFIEKDGQVTQERIPTVYWILGNEHISSSSRKLKGNLFYNWFEGYDSWDEWNYVRGKLRNNDKYWSIWDVKEQGMLLSGVSLFKGMQVEQVSTLAFDIESTSLDHTYQSKVLLISNTFEKNGVIERKLFAYDDYSTEKDFFNAWTAWVRDRNPSVLVGHNLFCYDLPYISHCMRKCGARFDIGRDRSEVSFEQWESKYRRDSTQFYTYNKAHVYGRHIIDTLFLAYKHDIGKKYESYRLKSIIDHEGLQVKDRQFYDAGLIWKNYQIPEEWNKIKNYAIHDADDALNLYKLMIAPFFYLTRMVPKSFQQVNLSASGAQIDSIMIRSYLQYGWSIPHSSDAIEYEGALSHGNPGIYKNVSKLDIQSLYPSIMSVYKVNDLTKDPNENFLKLLEIMKRDRIEYKKRGQETDLRYFKDMDASTKVILNSLYGMLGANGLKFNNPKNAAFITEKGREILTTAIEWCNANSLIILNYDTDSVSFCKHDQSFMTQGERDAYRNDLNSLFPEGILWCDDGYMTNMAIFKAKNYCYTTDNVKIKTKGSSIRSSTREPAFREFIEKGINIVLDIK